MAPYDPGGAELDDLVRSGRVRRSHGALPARFWEQPGPPDTEGHLLAALLAERENGR